jgi:hypothetical protein
MEGVHRSDPERNLRLTEEDFYEITDSGTLLLPESQSLDFTRFNIMMLKRLRAYLQRKSAEVVLHMSNPAEMEALLLSSKYLMVETSIISNLVQASAAAVFDHREQFGQLNEQTKAQAEFSALLGSEKLDYDMRQMRKELGLNVQEDAGRSLCLSPPPTITPALSAYAPPPDRSQHEQGSIVVVSPTARSFDCLYIQGDGGGRSVLERQGPETPSTPPPVANDRLVKLSATTLEESLIDLRGSFLEISPPPIRVGFRPQSKPLISDEPSAKFLDSAHSVNGVSSTQLRLEHPRTGKYFGSRPNSASQPAQPLPQIPQIPQIRKSGKFATSANLHWQQAPLAQIRQILQRRSKTLPAAPDVTVVTANGRDFVPKQVLDDRIMLDQQRF